MLTLKYFPVVLTIFVILLYQVMLVMQEGRSLYTQAVHLGLGKRE